MAVSGEGLRALPVPLSDTIMTSIPFRYLAGQQITMSGTSQKSSAAPAGTRAVAVSVLAQPGYVAVGGEPVATSANFAIPASQVVILSCSVGEKVAVLQAGTAGTINISFLG